MSKAKHVLDLDFEMFPDSGVEVQKSFPEPNRINLQACRVSHLLPSPPSHDC